MPLELLPEPPLERLAMLSARVSSPLRSSSAFSLRIKVGLARTLVALEEIVALMKSKSWFLGYANLVGPVRSYLSGVAGVPGL